MRQLIAPCLLMALTLAACSATDTAMTTDSSRNTGPKSELDLRPKHNPHPTKARLITLTIDNAPGPFGSVRGYAQYDASNYAECGRPVSATGTRMRVTSMEPFELKRISETEYQGTIYEDLMVDEDYYGAGVCRWEIAFASMGLSATGAEGETGFSASLDKASIEAAKAVTFFFPADAYPITDGYPNYPVSGKERRDYYKESLRDRLFSATLKADAEKEVLK